MAYIYIHFRIQLFCSCVPLHRPVCFLRVLCIAKNKTVLWVRTAIAKMLRVMGLWGVGGVGFALAMEVTVVVYVACGFVLFYFLRGLRCYLRVTRRA